jgi:hypothetical protein
VSADQQTCRITSDHRVTDGTIETNLLQELVLDNRQFGAVPQDLLCWRREFAIRLVQYEAGHKPQRGA